MLLGTPVEGHGKHEETAGAWSAATVGIARRTIVVVAAHRRAIYQRIARIHAHPMVKNLRLRKSMILTIIDHPSGLDVTLTDTKKHVARKYNESRFLGELDKE